MSGERGGIKSVMSLDIGAERAPLLVDVGRQVDRGGKPIERKSQAPNPRQILTSKSQQKNVSVEA